MDKATKILSFSIVLLVILSIGVTFYDSVILGNFTVVESLSEDN